jgi:septal ring-binding cell division protein DamX
MNHTDMKYSSGDGIRRVPWIIVIFLSLSVIPNEGCSSSEESGSGRQSEESEMDGPISPVPDAESRAADPAVSIPDGLPEVSVDGSARDPLVRRGQDTLHALTSRVTRSSVDRQPLQKPPNAMYTVQVAAFRRAPNALSLQRSLKEQYGEQLVYNLYTEDQGLYRVTLGKFETLREASNYRKTLINEHPQRFAECWVTYIERSQ